MFVLFVASLVLNLIVTGWNPSAAFYLLPTRGWELAAGGLVYLIVKQGLVSNSFKKNGYWIGWILVITSFFFITEHLAWPGYWAIFPVLGTSLIILGQRENCKLTDNAIAQWLGDRSYSLYLWHWPLVVALYFAGLENDWTWVISFFALSIILTHFSYQLIETPTRKYLSQAKLLKEILVIASAGIVIGLSAVSIKKFVFDDRLPEAIEIASRESVNEDPRKDDCKPSADGSNPKKCIYGQNTINAILMGDSHSQAIVSAVGQAASNNESGILFWGKSSCATIDRKSVV